MNLGGSKDEVYEFGRKVIKEDIERMDSLGIEYMCFHPGSHVGGGIDFGIQRIVDALNETLTGEENITVLLDFSLLIFFYFLTAVGTEWLRRVTSIPP